MTVKFLKIIFFLFFLFWRLFAENEYKFDNNDPAGVQRFLWLCGQSH